MPAGLQAPIMATRADIARMLNQSVVILPAGVSNNTRTGSVLQPQPAIVVATSPNRRQALSLNNFALLSMSNAPVPKQLTRKELEESAYRSAGGKRTNKHKHNFEQFNPFLSPKNKRKNKRKNKNNNPFLSTTNPFL